MKDQEPKVSNPLGRPKGSKNEVTLLKIAMEHGVRSKNVAKIEAILNSILDDALAGVEYCRKMVWQSVMSKAGVEQQQSAGEVPQIVLRVEGSPAKVKQVDIVDAIPTPLESIVNE